ncbi:hypothetical protein Taro_044469 [Colocasia esculenta]|uniref:Uncharacterized protein n=1 Tax=Colocasia esculenta TaxID=4460 RepID=A0A843X0W1_COLES|nr:hypothetical protein [Colocasia esculenta]
MAASGSSGSVGGYSVAFLTVDQQEQFAAVKIKLRGNKAVDIEDLEKHGMNSIVEAIQRMKWSRLVTVSEPSYPDLAKAFYTCLKTEEDGSLSSSVKGTPIHITYDLLERLFGVSTIGRSGVDTIDIHAKGLGIIGTECRLKDGKIDINQLNDINMAQVIIERMKFAAEMIWDKKNKLNVSLPYAHLLTRIFKHYGIDLKREVMEKMSQPIRSKNLKKSGFFLVGNVWTKTSVAEGEAIIGGAPEIPIVQEEEEEAEVRVEETVAVARRIEEIAPEHIEPGEQEETHEEIIPNIPAEDVNMEESQETVIPEIVALGHISAPADKYQEGLVESTSDGDDSDDVEPVEGSAIKGKGVAPLVPLLTRKAHQSSKKRKIHVGLKPIINRLNAHGEILCSVQSEITSIFISQSIGAMKNELQEMRGELGSLKQLVTDLSNIVRVHLSSPAPPAPTQPVSEEPAVGPLGPVVEESGPPGPSMEKSGPPGQSAGESRPSGPVESKVGQVRTQEPVEATVVPLESPTSSPLQTPAPLSPPSSSIAPLAPETFKQPLPRHTSSTTSSTAIPPPPIFEDPLASYSGPSAPPPPTSFSSLHPPTPPSFITLISESARVQGHIIQNIKDEFEEVILRSVLTVGTHVHRTCSSSLAPKKRKVSKDLALYFDHKFPPLWFSLSVENRRRSLYCEYLHKCTFAVLFGLPHVNLTDHLTIVLPLSPLSKPDQSKIFSMAESKTEDQWSRGHQSLYRKYLLAKSDRFPPRDHPLTLSEWFVIHHKNT